MINHHQALETFEEQLEYALNSYTPHGYKLEDYSNIVICGLGGSGISGQMMKSYVFDKVSLPVETVSAYSLPAYVNNKTLVILASYSGNTEETLAMFEDAKAKGATMIIMASGGKLMELAQQNNLPLYAIKTGYQPRQALGFSFGFLAQIFDEFVEADLKAELVAAKDAITNEKERLKEDAAEIYNQFKKTLREKFVIVTDNKFEAVGVRFTQQLQENSKCEAFVNVLPEANHNVIESYYGHLETNFILLRTLGNDRVNARFDFLNSLLEVENNKVVNLAVEDYNLRTILNVVYILDWISVWAADDKGVDSMVVGNIMSLKDFLSEI